MTGVDGFSLVEMLVVLAILAVVATIGVPSVLAALPAQRLATTSDRITDEINRLRAEAVRTGQGASLIFDPEANRFASTRRGAGAIATTGLRVDIEASAATRAGPGEVRFLPDGGSTGGRITLADGAGARLITVSRVTGTARAMTLP